MNGSDVITMNFKVDFQCWREPSRENATCIKPHYPMPKKVRLLDEGIVKVSQCISGFVTFPMCPLNFRNGPRGSGKKAVAARPPLAHLKALSHVCFWTPKRLLSTKHSFHKYVINPAIEGFFVTQCHTAQGSYAATRWLDTATGRILGSNEVVYSGLAHRHRATTRAAAFVVAANVQVILARSGQRTLVRPT
jgi:hypothetical protein